MNMEDIIYKVSEFTGVSIEDMKSKKRKRPIVMARRMSMYLANKLLGETTLSIAGYMGCTQQNVSFQLICFDQELRIYKGFRKQVDEMKKFVNLS
jgi:hypothetical protein